jgi:hypothetical protein
LASVTLLGCPNWDELTEEQCRSLGATTGVCASLAADGGTGGGGGATGGGGGAATGGGTATGDGGADAVGDDAGRVLDAGPDTGNDDAGVMDAGFDAGTDAGVDAGNGVPPGQIVAFDATVTLVSSLSSMGAPTPFFTKNDQGRGPRVPVLIGTLPTAGYDGGRTVVVETWLDGGFAIWRQGDFAQSGSSASPWCASATNDLTSVVGHVSGNSTTTLSLTVDQLAGASRVSSTRAMPACTPALSQYQGSDGGVVFVGIESSSSSLLFRPATCTAASCTEPIPYEASLPPAESQVDEAAIDGTQRTWVSVRYGRVNPVATLLSVAPYSDTPTSYSATEASTSRVHLAAGHGNPAEVRVHAAWMNGRRLYLRAAAFPGGIEETLWWDFGDPVELIDVADNGRYTVVLLWLANAPLFLVHRHAVTDAFVSAPMGQFKPTVAHLGAHLRVTGHCLGLDGGVGTAADGCGASPDNRVFSFDRVPDGSLWR